MGMYLNSAEGIIAGTAASSANTGGGSGDAFATVNTAGSLVVSTAHSAHGTRSYAVQNASGYGYALWNISGKTATARVYIWFDTLPTVDTTIIRFAAGGGSAGTVLLPSSNSRLRAFVAGGSHGVAPTAFPTGQWVRVVYWVDTAAGSCRLAYYLGDSTTPIHDTGVITGLSIGGGADFTTVALGKYDTFSDTTTRWIDSLGVKYANDAVMFDEFPMTMPSSTNVVPIDDISGIEPETSFSYTASLADGSTATSWSWRQVSGTPVVVSNTGATVSLRTPSLATNGVPVSTTIVLGVTATIGSQTTVEEQFTITVLPQLRWVYSSGAYIGKRPKELL